MAENQNTTAAQNSIGLADPLIVPKAHSQFASAGTAAGQDSRQSTSTVGSNKISAVDSSTKKLTVAEIEAASRQNTSSVAKNDFQKNPARAPLLRIQPTSKVASAVKIQPLQKIQPAANVAPIVPQDSARPKTAAEIETASKQKVVSQSAPKSPEAVFKPLPREGAFTKTSAQIEKQSESGKQFPVSGEQPAVVPKVASAVKIQPLQKSQPLPKIQPASKVVLSPKTQPVQKVQAKTQLVAKSSPPKVSSPLPQNSATIAAAVGLTSAQIERQSKQDTIAPQLTVPKILSVSQLLPKAQPFPKIQPASKVALSPKTQPAQEIQPIVKAAPALKIQPVVNAAPAVHKTLPQTATTAVSSAQNSAQPNPSLQKEIQAKSAGQQFLNYNQKATGNFIDKLFGRDKKTPAENSAAAIASPPQEKDLQRQIVEAEKIYQQGLASVRDLISPSSLETHYDHLSLSGVFARSFFVYAYPRFLESGWMSQIINFDATVDIAQFIYPIASNEIMRILKKKVAQIQSSITMASEKGNVRDPQLETALEDAEQLRTDLQRGQEKFFQFGMYFTVYASDLKKLETTTKIIENQLGGKLVLTKRADIRGEHAFNSTLPLCTDELEIYRNMNTSPLATTFPFISSSLASDEGILYGLNRHNNSLIIFDRFKLPNANSCVFATSGAGKSYAVKLEILRQVMLGTDVIVVDPENEYKAIVETVGGTHLNVSLNSDQRINPFDLPTPFEGNVLKPGDLLRESVITLTGLMKLILGKMSAGEEAMIDKALIDTYAVRGVTMQLEDPSKMPMPTMEDFHSVLSSMKGAEELAQRLQKFTSGTFGGIFNRETNVDLGSGLIVFGIRDLEDELRPAAMFIILNFIWNRVRGELKRRILVVDEAWTMMQHEAAAKFLFGLVKRARKYYLGVTTITQDVEDFLGSKYGRPIVTNASIQLLLKQSPSSMEILQKTFNLTEGEKYMLLNSGVGQGLFFADSKHVAVQVIASYSENQIVTTNPQELLERRGEGF
ncbi:MAG: ATP-binding protein [Patescibacteria group bacterium]